MAALFEVDRGHDDEVDSFAQLDEILLSHVFDLFSGWLCEIRLDVRALLAWLLEVIANDLFLN